MQKALPLDEARALVLASAAVLPRTETVPLAAAHGRRLAVAIAADTPWPTTDRSAMDGFAVAAGGGLPAGTALPVVGESLAGRPFARSLAAGEAIRIMTGAVVPAGADAVVPVEQTSGYERSPVVLHQAVAVGQHVRRAGSELQPGQAVLAAGQWLDAPAIGALAVLGHAQVRVAARPRVAIVATGDEVVPVDCAPQPHQVRESNSWALAAQVAACGGEPLRLGIAPDEREGLLARLRQGLADADVLVTIGGVSQGTHDLVHPCLGELGVATVFHGLALKPGKPTFFGTRAVTDGARWVFGLPGNPASSLTVFDLLVRPLLAALGGADPGAWTATLPVRGAPWRPNPRLQAIPARLHADGDGAAVELLPVSPSGDPFGVVGRQLYALVPPQQACSPGATLRIAGATGGIDLP